MPESEQYATLKVEVVRLFEHLQKIKKEVAAIKHPRSNIDCFSSVADQLNAIVKATEEATETIMESTEDVMGVVDDLKEEIKYEGASVHFDKITEKTNLVFEACSFQDITGQRISKIVKEMNLIEGALNSLVVIIGEEGLKALPLEGAGIHESEDGDVPMHGPQLEGEGVSQEDIDKLFD
ncbi:MAG TPA: hypothetical protein ENI79_02460 [Rhodospirillales bacterium]|nr:hypothetical protein [Rhodospirillales bacterium]